jgi:hypothetical protein
MAFDDYCAAAGYEQAIPVMRQWLYAPHANLRCAVSEGLRQWTAGKRVAFANDPRLAIDLLGTLKDDPSRYVQESAGNALRDIGRKHPDLVSPRCARGSRSSRTRRRARRSPSIRWRRR